MHRIIIGVSGACGMPIAEELLKNILKVPNTETHLVISRGSERVLQSECNSGTEILTRYAYKTYDAKDMSAAPASGAWQNDGMIICPCSMSSLASIASGAGMNLIHRSADVTLKERRPLIIAPRETPLNLIHLRNMQLVTEAGATIMPFAPAFYNNTTSFKDMIQYFSGRMLDQLHIEHNLCLRWGDEIH